MSRAVRICRALPPPTITSPASPWPPAVMVFVSLVDWPGGGFQARLVRRRAARDQARSAPTSTAWPRVACSSSRWPRSRAISRPAPPPGPPPSGPARRFRYSWACGPGSCGY